MVGGIITKEETARNLAMKEDGVTLKEICVGLENSKATVCRINSAGFHLPANVVPYLLPYLAMVAKEYL
ncbi:hypothetical protein Pmani_002552 [Petrolisthes manimaculis]|uniref:Uncharacterized protein n=1 Tax=Petrolisthes manimaculis TaxID=1843537 RepID=A0AAE1QHB3_9EUCA|nr:hypothetical protein Pmani_002552 [Petrolisthes manimaculis]